MWRLARLDTASGEFEPIDTPFTDIDEVRGGPGFAVFRAASPMTPRQIVRLDVEHPDPNTRQAFITLTNGERIAVWGRDADLLIAWADRHAETITD